MRVLVIIMALAAAACALPAPNATAGRADSDGDAVPDSLDNCPSVWNPGQGDADNYSIGDACDYEDVKRVFRADYRDALGRSYDEVAGGGPCNQPGGCSGDDTTDVAYCPDENWCVYMRDCVKGDGTSALDVDGDGRSEGVCVGYAWWDADSGGDEFTGIPGLEICQECGYHWSLAEGDTVGEYAWNSSGYGCCGDDKDETYYRGRCIKGAPGHNAIFLFPLDEALTRTFGDISGHGLDASCDCYATPITTDGPFLEEAFVLEEDQLGTGLSPVWTGPGDVAYGVDWLGVVMRSDDHGEHWSPVYEFQEPTSTLGLWVGPDGTVFAGREGTGLLYRTAQGDSVWSAEPVFVCQDQSGQGYGTFWHMDADSLGYLYAGEYGGTWDAECAYVHRSADGGATWEVVYDSSDYGVPGRHVHFVGVDPFSGSVYAAQGDDPDRARLVRSDDQGETWTTLEEGTLNAQYTSSAFAPGYRLFGTDRGDGYGHINFIVRTDDDETFDIVGELCDDEDGFVWGMSRAPDGTIYAGTVTTQSGEENPGIFATSDGGATWRKLKDFGRVAQGYAGIEHISNFDSAGYAYYHNSASGKSYRFRPEPSLAPEGARWFDGEGDFVRVRSDPILDVTDEISIAYWFRLDSRDSLGYAVSKGTKDAGSWAVRHGTDGKIVFYLQTEQGSTVCWLIPSAFDRASWHAVVITYGAESGVSFYLDGHPAVTGGIGCGPRGSIAVSDYDVLIGAGGAAEYFRGSLAYVCLYDRIMSETEIEEFSDPSGRFLHEMKSAARGKPASVAGPGPASTGASARPAQSAGPPDASNYPNPFNPSTRIRYAVPEPGGPVLLEVYNLSGRLIRRLVDGERSPGTFEISWYGTDERGREVPSGCYFLRLEVGGSKVVRKMLLLR